MRNSFKPPECKIDFQSHFVQNKPGHAALFVANHNKQMSATGRTTSAYILNNDKDNPACAGSYYLLPDPYCNNADCEENDLQDFISDDEEKMLYNQPLITNNSLYKIY